MQSILVNSASVPELNFTEPHIAYSQTAPPTQIQCSSACCKPIIGTRFKCVYCDYSSSFCLSCVSKKIDSGNTSHTCVFDIIAPPRNPVEVILSTMDQSLDPSEVTDCICKLGGIYDFASITKLEACSTVINVIDRHMDEKDLLESALILLESWTYRQPLNSALYVNQNLPSVLSRAFRLHFLSTTICSRIARLVDKLTTTTEKIVEFYSVDFFELFSFSTCFIVDESAVAMLLKFMKTNRSFTTDFVFRGTARALFQTICSSQRCGYSVRVSDLLSKLFGVVLMPLIAERETDRALAELFSSLQKTEDARFYGNIIFLSRVETIVSTLERAKQPVVSYFRLILEQVNGNSRDRCSLLGTYLDSRVPFEVVLDVLRSVINLKTLCDNTCLSSSIMQHLRKSSQFDMDFNYDSILDFCLLNELAPDLVSNQYHDPQRLISLLRSRFKMKYYGPAEGGAGYYDKAISLKDSIVHKDLEFGIFCGRLTVHDTFSIVSSPTAIHYLQPV